MPSDLGGRGGGAIAPWASCPSFGREGSPILPFEKVELRDLLDATEVRWLSGPLLLVMLP